jgi:hypothetical protein
MAASCGDEAQGAADFFTGLSAGPSSPVATWGDRRTFGSIDGFALLDSGVAVVSDATKGHLHLFLDGKDARSFGRLGPDSADFSTMGSVAALRSDTFVVLDPNRGRLVGFRRVADSVVRLGRVDLPFPVKGVCSLDGRLFVLGRYDSTLVHETTVRGGVLKSFGALEGSTPFEISMNAAAEIACSQEAGAVAVASRVPGELRVFSADGTLVRTDSIAGFVRSSYGRRETGERAPPGANASWNTVEDLRWFGKDLLVQLARMPKPDRAAFESRWLFASGVWKESVPAWPRVLGHDAHGRVYVAVTDPYPVVKLYKVRR